MHIDAREFAKQNPGVLEAPRFTDLDGESFQREKPLSVLEFNELEVDWQGFLADAAAGLITKESFQARLTPIIERMGWPVDRVLALPDKLFWAVLESFFVSPEAEGQPPAKATTTKETPAPAPSAESSR